MVMSTRSGLLVLTQFSLRLLGTLMMLRTILSELTSLLNSQLPRTLTLLQLWPQLLLVRWTSLQLNQTLLLLVQAQTPCTSGKEVGGDLLATSSATLPLLPNGIAITPFNSLPMPSLPKFTLTAILFVLQQSQLARLSSLALAPCLSQL